jgi:hypothetical protein
VTEGLTAEDDGEGVEESLLNSRQERRDVRSEIVEGADEGLAKAVGEHEVEELVHVLGEDLTDGPSEVLDAEEDGVLRRCVLAPSSLQAVFDGPEDGVEVGRHGRADVVGDVADRLVACAGVGNGLVRSGVHAQVARSRSRLSWPRRNIMHLCR